MKTDSIRSRLLKWLAIPLGLVSLLAFIIIFILLNRNVNQHFDNTLLIAAKSIEERLYVRDGILKFSLPHFGIELQTSSGNGSVFYSVTDVHDKLLVGFEELPKPKQLGEKVFFDATYIDKTIRALYIEHKMYRNGLLYKANIIVAETLEDREALISEILLTTIVITLLIVFIAIVASLFSVKKGLEPLINLEHFIRKRDINDLTPLSNDIPSEVEALVASINKLFKRLKKSFSHVERFNADVSHQIRTPLAEFKVLLDTDEELKKSSNKKKYYKIIDTMAHTTEQLLLWTKTHPDTFDRDWFRPMNLSEFCENYAKQKVPFIYQQDFEFNYNVDTNLWIKGGPIIIGSMLNNLIDNALKYSVSTTKMPQGEITLSLKKVNNKIVLSIEDEGKGIDQEHFTKIFNRFYRVDTKASGSGLGLGIVKQICELHQAKIDIYNKKTKGLRIDIHFKSYQPS